MVRVSLRVFIGLAALLALTALACSTSALPQVAVPAVAEATAEDAAAEQVEAAPTAEPTPTPLPEEVVEGAVASQDEILTNVYERVSPAVVNIDVSARNDQNTLVDFGSGSGFVIDTEGHIVTNNHVVADADAARVTFSDGTVLEAEVLGVDPFSDLAVLRVTPPEGFTLTPVEFGDSQTLEVGQMVIAIGNPFGLSGSMTVGIISAIGRTLPSLEGTFSNPMIIQTDAAINPGNSGGPLLDAHGRVIGVNAAIRSETGVSSGIAFAIPVNTVKQIVPQLIENGEASYPYLGITGQSTPSLAELAVEYDLPTRNGALIAEVQPGGPADAAGLRGGTEQTTFRGIPVALGGDIITAVDGTEIHNFDELLGYLVSNTRAGQEVTLTIIRDGQTMEVPVTLAERPENFTPGATPAP